MSNAGCTSRASLNTSLIHLALVRPVAAQYDLARTPRRSDIARQRTASTRRLYQFLVHGKRRIERRELRIELGVLRIEIARGDVEVEASREPGDDFQLRALDLGRAGVADEVLGSGVDRELHVLVVVVEYREVCGHAPIEPARLGADFVAVDESPDRKASALPGCRRAGVH